MLGFGMTGAVLGGTTGTLIGLVMPASQRTTHSAH